MAESTVHGENPGGRELTITIWRDWSARFEGSAAQLIAEGLIPEGFEWPQRGATSKSWQATGFNYRLRRCRPPGHRGPMRSWLEIDNWCVSVEVIGRDFAWRTRRELERKTEELRAEYYRHTAAGSREWDANWNRYLAALSDPEFQAFKSLTPGLVPPRRGRKPKEAIVSDPAADLSA